MKNQSARIRRVAEKITPNCSTCQYRQAAEYTMTPEERRVRLAELKAEIIAEYLAEQAEGKA